MKAAALITFLLCFAGARAQTQDCQGFRNGSFVYPENRGKLSVREGKEQKSFNNGKLEMLWDVRWISDCEYELTCRKMYVKGYPFRKGDRIYAKIVETDEDCFTVETVIYNSDFPNGSGIIPSTMCRQE